MNNIKSCFGICSPGAGNELPAALSRKASLLQHLVSDLGKTADQPCDTVAEIRTCLHTQMRSTEPRDSKKIQTMTELFAGRGLFPAEFPRGLQKYLAALYITSHPDSAFDNINGQYNLNVNNCLIWIKQQLKLVADSDAKYLPVCNRLARRLNPSYFTNIHFDTVTQQVVMGRREYPCRFQIKGLAINKPPVAGEVSHYVNGQVNQDLFHIKKAKLKRSLYNEEGLDIQVATSHTSKEAEVNWRGESAKLALWPDLTTASQAELAKLFAKHLSTMPENSRLRDAIDTFKVDIGLLVTENTIYPGLKQYLCANFESLSSQAKPPLVAEPSRAFYQNYARLQNEKAQAQNHILEQTILKDAKLTELREIEAKLAVNLDFMKNNLPDDDKLIELKLKGYVNEIFYPLPKLAEKLNLRIKGLEAKAPHFWRPLLGPINGEVEKKRAGEIKELQAYIALLNDLQSKVPDPKADGGVIDQKERDDLIYAVSVIREFKSKLSPSAILQGNDDICSYVAKYASNLDKIEAIYQKFMDLNALYERQARLKTEIQALDAEISRPIAAIREADNQLAELSLQKEGYAKLNNKQAEDAFYIGLSQQDYNLARYSLFVMAQQQIVSANRILCKSRGGVNEEQQIHACFKAAHELNSKIISALNLAT